MNKTNKERLKKIVKIWLQLSSQIEQRGITEEQLLNDEFSQWAVSTPLYNIGEQVYKLDREFKDCHPDFPWSKVAGLRHRLVHEYDDINWTIIAQVIFHEMEPFVNSIKQLLDEPEQQEK